MPKTSKEKTGVYIVYIPASRVINIPRALGSYFQPIRLMSKVYFIIKLFVFHTFCVKQLLSTLHASLSCSMCMCHLVMSCEIIKQEMPGSGHFSSEHNMFPLLQYCNKFKRFRASRAFSTNLQWLPCLHSVATANSDDDFHK